MKQLVKLVLALLILVISAEAQTIIVKQSRIVDIDGRGLPDVTITETAGCLDLGTGMVTKTYVTDAAGNFDWPQTLLPDPGTRCAQSVSYSFTLNKAGHTFTRASFGYKPGDVLAQPYDHRLPLIHVSTAPAWVNVPAASFAGDGILTSNTIAAGFGTNLAEGNLSAGETLPLTLGNRRVLVNDSTGIQQPAKLYFVSPGQINYVLPEGLADGSAVIRLVSGSGELLKVGLVEIRPVAPAIFTANANGRGVPAGLLVRVRPGNVQNYEPLAQFNATTQRFDPLPIDLGPPEQFLVLALFGTGWRQTPNLWNASVYIGEEVNCPVEYVGQQPSYEGLDQLNVRLPRELIGRGEVPVYVRLNGVAANIVTLNFK